MVVPAALKQPLTRDSFGLRQFPAYFVWLFSAVYALSAEPSAQPITHR